MMEDLSVNIETTVKNTKTVFFTVAYHLIAVKIAELINELQHFKKSYFFWFKPDTQAALDKLSEFLFQIEDLPANFGSFDAHQEYHQFNALIIHFLLHIEQLNPRISDIENKLSDLNPQIDRAYHTLQECCDPNIVFCKNDALHHFILYSIVYEATTAEPANLKIKDTIDEIGKIYDEKTRIDYLNSQIKKLRETFPQDNSLQYYLLEMENELILLSEDLVIANQVQQLS